MFRQNFLKACQILLDNTAQMLRTVCQKEFELYGYKIPDCLLQKDFSSLADHLINPKERLLGGRACQGSFFLFASSHATISSIHAEKPLPPFVKKKWAELKVLRWDGQLQEIPNCKFVVVNLMKSTFTKVNRNTLYLHREPSKGEKRLRYFEVYFATKKHDAVHFLRGIRNEKIGHSSCVAMTDDEFKTLFEDVTKCYEDLDVDDGFVQELQRLKQGSTIF